MNATTRRISLISLCAILLFAAVAAAQDAGRRGGRGQNPNQQRQQPAGRLPRPSNQSMWPAPKAEDWKNPCLIKWQRTWEDATTVSHQTGKAILICVNMDGEPASEHYAGIRYRDPEPVALYEPYVCVVASVYRHTPRDYDEEGRRIECPRFGTVTCGEHIAIEPVLFEKYFDGQRVAPRHIMIELDGSESYDVFFTWDVVSVFNQLRDGIVDRGDVPITVVRGDRPIVERVASRDVRDREAVENAYREGDADLRRQLLGAADNADVASPDLLRQAIFGFDTEMSKIARQALTKSSSADSVDLIVESLQAPMDAPEREKMLGTLQRIGESSSSPRAQWLSTVHRGLGTTTGSINVESWSSDLGGAEYGAPESLGDWGELQAKLDQQSEASRSKPQDAEALLDVAEAALTFARQSAGEDGIFSESSGLLTADPRTARRVTRSRWAEARDAALEARELGASGWRVNSILTLSSYYLGDLDVAYTRAETAAEEVPEGATDWSSMAVLTIFAEGRFQAIKKAVQAKEDWPPRWLTDVHSAYSVLLRHPLGDAGQVVWHYDFLVWLGARRYASRVIDQGLARYPSSPELHARMRTAILDRRGVDGLEARYEAMLEMEGVPPSHHWFAGLASFVAAEFHRRAGDFDASLAAYQRSIDHYDRSIEADAEMRDSADFNVALALAGRARIAFDAGDIDNALIEILASFARKQEAAGTLDGLNITPAGTAQLLLEKLEKGGSDDSSARLRAVLETLDPEHLEEPYIK